VISQSCVSEAGSEACQMCRRRWRAPYPVTSSNQLFETKQETKPDVCKLFERKRPGTRGLFTSRNEHRSKIYRICLTPRAPSIGVINQNPTFSHHHHHHHHVPPFVPMLCRAAHLRDVFSSPPPSVVRMHFDKYLSSMSLQTVPLGK